MALKYLQEADLSLLLSWRNSLVVRQAMYNQHKISLKEHYSWFHRVKNDPSIRCFVWIDPTDNPQGFVNFTSLDLGQRSATWGFYVSPTATPGSGLGLALEALELVFTKFNLMKLSAEVIQSNVRSMDFHKKIGFTKEGCFREQYFDGRHRIDVIRFGMLANEWSKHRRRLKARLALRNMGKTND
jgi:UDP-4-amino-4,6-dideoxy-N-acetyl-beta-L-altrosamine N-acetyltransferase